MWKSGGEWIKIRLEKKGPHENPVNHVKKVGLSVY